jgi:hypothetical protein
MIRFENAPEPAGFQDAVKENLEDILDEFTLWGTVDFKGRETWKRFKSDLAPATFGKCGYCEVDVVTVDRYKGDVEHYRPKGRVDRLVIEADDKMKSQPLFASGYHWLAYSWDNYILTCNPCNSSYKRNFFPLNPEPAAPPKAGDEADEDALLLNPFGPKDPAEHLAFDHLGVVGSREGSAYGATTIAVCGLWRPPLEKKRRNLAILVQRLLDAFVNPQSSDDKIGLALQIIADLGMRDREHCGMVRSMFAETTGLPWSFVEEQAPRPDPGVLIRAREAKQS